MSRYTLDPATSSIQVFTYAEGLFARLAHDLRLTVRNASFSADRESPTSAKVSGSVPLSGIQVDGVMKKGTLHEDVLSTKDKAEILEKMRSEVFAGAAANAEIHLEGTLTGDTFRVMLTGPDGRTASVTGTVTEASRSEGSENVSGALDVSVHEIAGHDVKGPLGAFRISDRVHVKFDANFTAAS